MFYNNIGLFSDGEGERYFSFLRRKICGEAIMRHIHVMRDEKDKKKPIIKLCEISKFDCVILLDDLVDSYDSRQIIRQIIAGIRNVCPNVKILAVSIWDDTLENESDLNSLILVGQGEPIKRKCEKIMNLLLIS